MIIGKNTNMQSKNPFIKENNNPSPINNPMIDRTRSMEHPDVTSKKEMNQKAYQILEDRLQKGLISMEEFNKKCRQLGKIK